MLHQMRIPDKKDLIQFANGSHGSLLMSNLLLEGTAQKEWLTDTAFI